MYEPYYVVFLTCLIRPYFSHYLINLAIVERMFLKLKYMFRFSVQICLTPRRIPKDAVESVHWGLCKVSVVVVGFLKYVERFSKTISIKM